MRVAIDTNVVFSGMLWRGAPHALLTLARLGHVKLVFSPLLLAELSDVVVRLKFQGKFARIRRSPAWLVAEVQTLVELVNSPPLPAPVCRDPDDDAVLALAIAAQADIIVSGDADLLILRSYAGIPIVTPAQALAIISPEFP